jgi:hypothetical protein
MGPEWQTLGKVARCGKRGRENRACTSESRIENVGSGCDVAPTTLAHGLVRAARSDLVVVCHVDIEYQLSSLRLKGVWSKRLLVSRLLRSHAEDFPVNFQFYRTV